MFKKERNVLDEIAEKLSYINGILKAFAYGSMVRGDNRDDSDMDVLIIVGKKERGIKEIIIDLFYSYELSSGIPFSVSILSLEEFEVNKNIGSLFIKGIEKEGIIFYDFEQRRKEDALTVSH